MKGELPAGEKQLLYVLAEIQLLESSLPAENEKKSPLIKQLVAWALQEFMHTNFKTDKRMLVLWYLLGKYSQEMKMEGVMQKLYKLGE